MPRLAGTPRFQIVSLLTFSTIVALGCGETEVIPAGSGGAGGAGSAATTSHATTSDATTSSPSSTSTTTSTGSGHQDDLSECQDDLDCPSGTCVDVNNGYKLCQDPVVEATECSDPEDECCTTADCEPGAKCVAGPPTAYCGGAQPSTANVCAKDECLTHADCADALCVPAGTVGNKINICLPAGCFGVICGQEHVASCALLSDPCCSAVPVGFYCAYECASNADCPDGYCELDPAVGYGVCKSGPAPCPP